MKNTNRGKPSRRRVKPQREAATCRYCREKIDYIDYKDIENISKLLTQRGKIFSRKRSGNCAGCQRKAQNAIKRARYMALLPYVS
ncbi:MAG: 30S ribosomal protein S18 [Sedimentisphaerales bacterium]|nr:30S ribosomal protein S18 [Sedimentisphaerales bacterium]